VGGQQVHSERLEMNADPWLVIRAKAPDSLGGVRDVQLLGSPTVPSELRLLAGSDLLEATNYFADEGAWTKTSDEIVSPALENAKGAFRERLLQYHRPLVEDGEVEYEFFYEPGKAEVHPALDRLVFLLAPAGPQIHWVTDAQYDRTGLAPDNTEPLPGGRPVPLKAREWNKLKLVLAGDEAAILVNGQEVARRTLEPTNQRTLGWFHYADVAAARIRNIVYRGQWPADVPPLSQQELATGPTNRSDE
jgi:hypothetical protein